jgi:hypothetical protein
MRNPLILSSPKQLLNVPHAPDSGSTADSTVDMLLRHFNIAAADARVFEAGRLLAVSDFEDAVVAAMAQAGACDYIVTRNVQDFTGSPVPAITPMDFLALLLQLPSGRK